MLVEVYSGTTQVQNTSTDSDLQRVFSELLKQGLSYIQIIIRYNMCKNLFKKGTPAFYQCMGVQPPPTISHTPPPHPQSVKQTEPSKPPAQKQQGKQSQGNQSTVQATTISHKTGEETIKYLILFGAILAVGLYLSNRRGKEK